MAYTTAQLDTIVATLESGLGQGFAEINYQERRLTYRSVAEIRNAIAYFKALYATASDAPVSGTPRVRTFLAFGGSRGFD